jgi:hypothetical protein
VPQQRGADVAAGPDLSGPQVHLRVPADAPRSGDGGRSGTRAVRALGGSDLRKNGSPSMAPSFALLPAPRASGNARRYGSIRWRAPTPNLRRRSTTPLGSGDNNCLERMAHTAPVRCRKQRPPSISSPMRATPTVSRRAVGGSRAGSACACHTRGVNNQGDGTLFDRSAYTYQPETDSYLCPAGKTVRRKQFR